jgi:hypothetical protein
MQDKKTEPIILTMAVIECQQTTRQKTAKINEKVVILRQNKN